MISAIIPVFNTEEYYLRRCIQSVLKQTYDDYEIIIIDDGSKKACADILDEIQQSDRRIQVWHKKNEGVSVARNFGIGVSKGQFVCFIDSDDTVERDFFQTAADAFENDVDLLLGKTRWIANEETIKHNINTSLEFANKKIYYLQKEEIKKEVFRKILLGPSSDEGFQPEVWCKMFRRSILEGLAFDKNIIIGEDQIFVLEYLLKCNAVGILNTHWYNYYVYQNSSLRKADADKAIKFIDYYKRLSQCLPSNLADDILPEKAYITLNELMRTYAGNKSSERSLLKSEYQAYKKFKNDRWVKQNLKRISITSSYAGFVDAVCCHLGFTKKGIKLMLLNVYAKGKEVLSHKRM